MCVSKWLDFMTEIDFSPLFATMVVNMGNEQKIHFPTCLFTKTHYWCGQEVGGGGKPVAKSYSCSSADLDTMV